MLEVEKKKKGYHRPSKEERKNYKHKDIIVTKHEQVIEYDENGNQTIKRIPCQINLTKKTNESKKLIKTYSAEQKLEELEKIFTK